MSDTATTSDRLDALRARLATFVAARDWAQFHTPKNLAICLDVEASELLELYMWRREGDGPHPPGAGPPPEARIREELGDVLISLLNFADRVGLDPIACAEDKLSALESKYPADAVRGSAVKASERAREAGE